MIVNKDAKVYITFISDCERTYEPSIKNDFAVSRLPCSCGWYGIRPDLITLSQKEDKNIFSFDALCVGCKNVRGQLVFVVKRK